MAKLKDVCDKITDGSHNPPQGINHSQYLMLSSKNIADDRITFENPRYLTEEDFVFENKRTAIKIGDLLLTIVGTVGRVAVVPPLDNEICLQRSVAVLKPKHGLVESRFLMYQLQHMRPILEMEAKGVAQKGIYLKQVENLEVSIPPLETQKQIAANLDKVTHTIDLCNAILEKLDLLVKSRFVEMFGDAVHNTKKWKTLLFGEITTKIGSGATPKGGRDSYSNEGISLIRSMNVHNGYFEYKDLAHISHEQAEKLDNVTIEENDVLLNITGASVARCCIVPNDILPARVNQHVCIIRCKTDVIPVFVCSVLTDDNYQKHLWDIAGSGATREAITKQQIENLSIIVPPLDLQNQFAAFVEQTDKSKSAVKQVLEKAETLKKALMQEYFG